MIGVMALDIADGQIQGISSIVNPDKLAPHRPGGRPPRAAQELPAPDSLT